VLLRNIGAEKAVSEFEFAGLFVRGNPLIAAESLIRYHLAKDEYSTVITTERFGQAKSRLAVDELLEALADPRFNVRFEAIISIARMPAEPRLVEALVKILNGSELSLSVVAAWALGRMGDPAAFEPLRQGLESPYRSIQAHSIRALGSLGNDKIAPLLLRRLRSETDKGLQMAYASALGKLRVTPAIADLLKLLRETQNEGARMELALSLARIAGNEGHFIQLWRQSRLEVSTATSQAVTALKKVFKKQPDKEVLSLLDRCAEALAMGEIAQGAVLLQQLIDLLPVAEFEAPRVQIIQHCRCCLAEFESPRLECLLLVLNILSVCPQS
jgi:HEAT repeat protein